MKKLIFLFIILTLTIIGLNFISRFYSLHLSVTYIGVSILLALSVILIFKFKRNQLKLLLIGLLSIVFVIVGTGFVFWLFNYYPRILYPVNYGNIEKFTERYEPCSFEESTFKAQGINSQELDNTLNNIYKLDFLKSFLILKNDKLIFEKYLNGTTKYDAFDIACATKTFTGILTGIAIENGFLKDENEKVKDIFPNYLENIDDKNEITIKHLLTMRSGLIPPRQRVYVKYNWINNILRYPVSYKPDEKYNYSSTDPLLLSAIITKKTKMSTYEFATKYLFEPTGINVGHWAKTPNDIYRGDYFFYITPRDMARFGQLLINKGKFNGQRIVSEKWIEKTFAIYSNTNEWREDIVKPSDYYGYLIWIDIHNGVEIYMAAGNYTQLIVIIPRLNMIIVTAAGKDVNEKNAVKLQRYVYDIINKLINIELKNKLE